MKNKLLILNTEPLDFSYGGVCPFMRNMHPILEKQFELDYLVLPDRIRKVPGSTRMKYLIYLIYKLSYIRRSDFVLSHSPEGSFISSFSKIPYAHIYHGNSNPMTISRFRIGKYFSCLYEKMYDRIERTASLLYSVGPVRTEKHRKLFNPIVQAISPLPIEERKGFIFAGRLEAMKNIDRLIKIYSKLPLEIKNENPFYIAGCGSQERRLKALSEKLGLSGSVFFLGNIPNSEIMRIMSEKKMLLMASSTEGMPTAIAEAFSVGLPVVSTRVGDVSSVVVHGRNGQLLDLEFDDNTYIQSVCEIIAHYKDYSKSAYEASHVFNREEITQQVADDIFSVLKKE